MKRWVLAIIGLVVLVVGAGVALVVLGGDDDGSPGAAEGPLGDTVDGCDELLATMQARAVASVTAYGMGSSFPFSSGPGEQRVVTVPLGASTFGGGGLQVPLEDGGLRTWARDGDRLVVLLHGVLHVLDLGGGVPAVEGSVAVGVATGNTASAQVMLALDGDAVLVVANGLGPAPEELLTGPVSTTAPVALVATVALGGPAPTVLERLWMAGSVVAVDSDGGRTRVAVASGTGSFDFLNPTGPSAEAAALEGNRQILLDSTLEDWMPSYVLEDGDGQVLDAGIVGGCSGVVDPDLGPGLGTVSVLETEGGSALDPDSIRTVIGAGAVRFDGDVVELFVPESHWPASMFGPVAIDPSTLPPPSTHVARLALPSGGVEVLATGEFDGFVTRLWEAGADGPDLMADAGNPWMGTQRASMLRLQVAGRAIEAAEVDGLAVDNRGLLRPSGDLLVTYTGIDTGRDRTTVYRGDGSGDWDPIDVDHEVGRVVPLPDGRLFLIGWDADGAVLTLRRDDGELTELARWSAPDTILGVTATDVVEPIGDRLLVSVLTFGGGPQAGLLSFGVDDTGPEPLIVAADVTRLLPVVPEDTDIGRSDCREPEPGEVPPVAPVFGPPAGVTFVCAPGDVPAVVGMECSEQPIDLFVAQLDDPGFLAMMGPNPFGLSEGDLQQLRELAGSDDTFLACRDWNYATPESPSAGFALGDEALVVGTRSVFVVAPDGTVRSTLTVEPPVGAG